MAKVDMPNDMVHSNSSPLVPIIIPTVVCGTNTWCCMQVAQMTKSDMAYSDASLLGPAVLFINQCFNCPIPEKTMLCAVCVSTIL